MTPNLLTKYLFLILFQLVTCTVIMGQRVIFQNINTNPICGQTSLSLQLINDTPIALNNSTLEVLLPCGLQYAPNSVMNGTEKNIANLQKPTFDIAGLNIDSSVVFTLLIDLPCAVKLCNDEGVDFIIEANWNNENNTVSAVSHPFNINSPNLIYTSISNTFKELVNENTFERTIQIRNTRLGELNSFTITETFDSPFYASSFPEGIIIQQNTTSITFQFDENVISQFGDLDDKFEINETIILTQIVTINACPYDVSKVESELALSWGCANETCQTEKRNTLTKIRYTAEGGDEMTSIAFGREPTCYKNTTAVQRASFENNATFSNFNNVVLTINATNAYSGIEDGSVDLNIPPENYSILYYNDQTTQCASYYNNARISLNKMSPGESIILTWNSVYCDTVQCNNIGSDWNVQYNYIKDCTSASDAVQTGVLNYYFQNILGQVNSAIVLDNEAVLSDGSILKIDHTFNSDELMSSEGQFYLEYDLPCGFEYVPSDYILNGIMPIDVVNIKNDTSNVLRLYYSMPFNGTSGQIFIEAIFDCEQLCILNNCELEFVGSCPGPCIETNSILGIVGGIYIQKSLNCTHVPTLKSATIEPQLFDCEKPVCIDSLPGWVNHHGYITRHTLGFEDNDDDGLPDSDQLANPQLIKHNRVMIGDTFDINIEGILNIDFQNDRTKRLFINIEEKYENMSPDDSEFAGDREFSKLLSNDGLSLLGISGIIKKNNGTQTYSLSQLEPHQLSRDRKLILDLSVDSFIRHGYLPQNFLYEQGDSIFIKLTKVVTYNFQSSEFIDVEPSVMELNYDTSFGFDLDETDNNFGSTPCVCKSTRLQLASIQFTKQKFGPYTPEDRLLCKDDENEFRKVSMAFGVRKGFFPNEYRSIYYPFQLTTFAKENYELLSSKLKILNKNNEALFDENIANWELHGLDKSYFLPRFQLDEYCRIDWEYTVNVLKDLACFTDSKSSKESVAVNYYLRQEIPLNNYIPYEDILKTELSFTINYPEFNLIFDKDFSESFTDTVFWDFTISNESQYVDAINPFIVIGDQNKFSNIKIFDLQTGLEIQSIGDSIFYLNDLSQEERKYRITAQLSSCNSENLIIKYGWDCDLFQLQTEPPCFSREIQVSGYIPPPTAEIDFPSAYTNNTLCEPTDYLEARFLNAGLGPLYHPEIQAKIPTGTTYIDGSSQIFNHVTGMFEMLNSYTQNDSIFWNISEIVDDYILGQNYAPLNEIRIRFKIIPDCDFTSGSPIIYLMNGEQICGRPSNIVKKVSPPIIIKNVVDTNAIHIDAEVMLNACSLNQVLTITILKDYISTNNQLTILLPNESVLVNENSNWNYNITGNEITYDLPEMNVSNSFSIEFELSASTKCGNEIIEIFATSLQNSFCSEGGNDCEIQTIVGNKHLAFDITKSTIEIPSIDIIPNQNLYDVEIMVDQVGDVFIEEVEIQLFIDNDQSGTFTAGDSIIYIGLNDIGGLDPILISDLDIKLSDLCRLYLFISQENNCICTDVLAPIGVPTVQKSPIFICENEEITIGIEMINGAKHLWDSTYNLSCYECAFTTLSPPYQQDQFTVHQSIVLQQDCRIDIAHEIIISELPHLLSSTESICRGDTLEIVTSTPDVVWQGDGLVEQKGNTSKILLNQNGFLVASLTNEFGCIAEDTLFVNVLDKPTVSPKDTSFCFGQQGKLSVNGSNDFTYFWINGQGFLSNVNIQNPSLLKPENQTFYLETDNGQCTALDSLEVSFYDGLNVDNIQDIFFICQGDPVEINLNPDNNYLWDPSFQVFCIDAPCSMVTIDGILSPTVFSVYAENMANCKDTFEVFVLPTEGEVVNTSLQYFCEGDSLIFDGVFITEQQSICDTLGTNCKIINCTEFRYFPREVTLSYAVTIEEGQSIELALNQTFEFYLWNEDETLSCTSCSTPIASPLETTDYILEVEDDNGCILIIRYRVNVISACEADKPLFPNVFTPDNNGNNDVFKIANYPIDSDKVESFRIFNEWGMMLVEKADNSGWDGSYKGEKAPPGTYLYVVIVQCNEDKSEKYSGSITIVR